MKKVWVSFGICLGTVAAFPVLGSAESVEQKVEAIVEEGSFGIRSSEQPLLTFDLGRWGEAVEGYINPVVVIDSISAPDQKSAVFLPNPYDGSTPIVDPEPWYDEKDYMIRIYNYESSSPDFKVTLSRSALKNVTTGEEITGEQLYFGNFHDSIDYKGVHRSQTIGEANKYWLASSSDISAEAALIADYRGQAALGEHWLSPFNVPGTDENGYRPFADSSSMPGQEDTRSYKENNISLAINNDTVIPSNGNYAATLVWTVEKSPN